ncbi:MAG: cobalt-precorrin-5B (C(1))-methyltransferase CbiD [Anaerovoracaceae bacterium]
MKLLKKGYTTGTCAAAATQGAVAAALTGVFPEKVKVVTPNNTELNLKLLYKKKIRNIFRCAVRKYSGDDPDVTAGALIYAYVSLIEDNLDRIILKGGKGVGTVTKPGLACKVNEPAINPVPRKMIINEARDIKNKMGFSGSIEITIVVPKGRELAKKTFNPKLGIVGGISILGTSGIVEPMSEQALIDTIKVELNVRKAEGKNSICITPGNYGQAFLKSNTVISEEDTVKCSNFIGDALLFVKEMGFKEIIFSGHLGKLVKVAGGVMNTHSKYGDRRMEIISNHLEKLGADEAIRNKIKNCVMVDDAIDILESLGFKEKLMKALLISIEDNVTKVLGKNINVGVITFSNKYGLLIKSSSVDGIIERMNRC